MKPQALQKKHFNIWLFNGASSSLFAHCKLAKANPEKCFHNSKGLRLPLGIYNISIHRICIKIKKLCEKLESYFEMSKNVDSLEGFTEIQNEIIDYIELSLYAAAEHVDDIGLIINGFFESTQHYKQNKSARTTKDTLDIHRAFISKMANFIKHNQSRIRLHSLNFTHDDKSGWLHGYFVEGVENGIVKPHPKFHNEKELFSATSLVWEILTFLLYSSEILSDFLNFNHDFLVSNLEENQPTCDVFVEAVAAAMRLPLYSFDEDHPFAKTTIVICRDSSKLTTPETGLYGSVSNQWSQSSKFHSDRGEANFQGDGVTRTFQISEVKNITLQHWE